MAIETIDQLNRLSLANFLSYAESQIIPIKKNADTNPANGIALAQLIITDYDASVAYVTGRRIQYGSSLYKVIVDTAAGDTPISAPSKFLSLGGIMVYSSLAIYNSGMLVIWTDNNLYQVESITTAGDTPLSAPAKFLRISGLSTLIIGGNFVTGGTPLAINKTTGLVSFSTAISGVMRLVIQNSLITSTSKVRLGSLNYYGTQFDINSSAGIPAILNHIQVTGEIHVWIQNFGTNATDGNLAFTFEILG